MKNRIYIKDWLLLKPYTRHTVTDNYYLRISNEVKKVFARSKYLFIIQRYINDDEINILSCFLTSYFEDIISETNIWNSFVNMHKRLYKKPLPFYNTDEYYEEEINHQDVRFLIWYFLNAFQDETYVEPINRFIFDLADEIMEVFDKAWDDAPENDYLKTFYQIDENEEDYYVVRNMIETILFGTYLFYPDTLQKLSQYVIELLDEASDEEQAVILINEIRDKTLHTIHTHLLSLKGKEWTAEILGKDHRLSEDLLNISERISAFFLYKGQDENNIFIEHIASGKKFDLTKKSFDHSDELKEIDTIMYLGMVQWKGEWWFSGVYFQRTFDANIVLDEKNSVESRMAVSFLDFQKNKADESLKKQMDVFLEFNNGSQIAFISSDEINKFNKEFVKYYIDSLNSSKKEIEEAKQRARKEGFFGSDDESIDFSGDSEPGFVFYNPKSGIEIGFYVNSAFPSPNNPFFDEAQSEEDLKRLLISEDFSKELAMYCVDNYKTKLPFFKSDLGKRYLQDFDFLLRFWKTDNYHATPKIAYTGSE